jgi:hypothetical protein
MAIKLIKGSVNKEKCIINENYSYVLKWLKTIAESDLRHILTI